MLNFLSCELEEPCVLFLTYLKNLCFVIKAPVWEVKAGKRIDDLLESFIGIRDQDLGELHCLQVSTRKHGNIQYIAP